MRLSFTGTREGMTEAQKRTVLSLLKELQPDWVIHGDCVGADSDFHNLIFVLRGGILKSGPPYIMLCPSSSVSTRAHNEYFDACHPPKAALERNVDIVDSSDKLIACPKTASEQLRSGTWYTVRYARRQNKIVYLVLPNGDIM